MVLPRIDTTDILALRPAVNRPEVGGTPLDILFEQESTGAGRPPAEVTTVMLRGSECAFRCLMCDLWKSTHPVPTPPGAIAAQVALAAASRQQHAKDQQHCDPKMAGDLQTGDQQTTDLQTTDQQIGGKWIKLYNASNFFASVNVPHADLPVIASHLAGFDRVIVENHPRVHNRSIADFQKGLAGKLEVAMGLETIHSPTLTALNKQMTLSDYQRACMRLLELQIDVRAFVLLRPPGMSEEEGIEWCSKSIEFARANGARHVSVIPLRTGNGAIEHLAGLGHFEPPLASSLEQILAAHVGLHECVITADLWDWRLLRGTCDRCSEPRRQRMLAMNLSQSPVALDLTCDRNCDCY